LNTNANGLTIADVMRDSVKTITSTTTLPEFEQRLLADGVSGYPVVDLGVLVGIVTTTDLVRMNADRRLVSKTR